MHSPTKLFCISAALMIVLMVANVDCLKHKLKTTTTTTTTPTSQPGSPMHPVTVQNITTTTAVVNWVMPKPLLATTCSLWWTCSANSCCKNWTEISKIKKFPHNLTSLTPDSNCTVFMQCTTPRGIQLKSPTTTFTTMDTCCLNGAVVSVPAMGDQIAPPPRNDSGNNSTCCADGWIAFKGACYWINRTKMDWSNANKTCMSMGAKMFMPMTMEEWDTIREFASLSDWFWISNEQTPEMTEKLNWMIKNKEHGKPSGGDLYCVSYHGTLQNVHYQLCKLNYASICKRRSIHLQTPHDLSEVQS